MKKVLILYAHPSPRRSEVNTHMARVAEWSPGITLVDLYARYPTLDIDVDAEQRLLRDHDVVIFLHPMFWYSTPAILKEWQDLVLEYGFAYGAGGTALNGKLFFSAVTTGGPREAYCAEGYNNFTLRQMMAPLEQTANLCGMTYLPPFVLHSARSARENGRIEPHLEMWEDLLDALTHEHLDIAIASGAETLNDAMATALKEYSR